MQYRKTTDYALSLPERLVRSLSGVIAGSVREVGEVVLPPRVRRSRLYSSVVGATLTFLIEQVGEIHSNSSPALPPDFILRKLAGNAIDMAAIAAFHASPLWVLSALSDLAGVGREIITEVSEALHEAGLIASNQTYSNVNELLNGLEMTTAQMAQSVHMPPMNVAALREDWLKLCTEASAIPRAMLPPPDLIRAQWNALKEEAALQQKSVVELSSLLTLAAIRALPDNARWLSRAVKISGRRTGGMFAGALFHHYRITLDEIRTTGYLEYWLREFQPYLKGAVSQFATDRKSLTERLLTGLWPHSKRNA